MNIINKIKYQILLYKWRRKGRRKKTVRMKINNVISVFNQFNQNQIRYVVLRWFDDVPLTAAEEAAYDQDVDMLIDVQDINQIALIASENSGVIKCDLYSITGAHGTAYKGMPYYPPILAEHILNNRVLHPNGFYVPSPQIHFYSLSYHLVYHKGLESGIPSGCEMPSDKNPKRPYRALLETFGSDLNIKLKKPYTLLSLHEYLKKENWHMPSDLMERWPKQTSWHKYLIKYEHKLLDEWAQKLSNLIIFIVREDAINSRYINTIQSMLKEKFEILRVEYLSEEQKISVARNVRGGNWIEHSKTTFIGPMIAIICFDHHPEGFDDPERARKYPLVKNKNVFRKHEIRNQLNRDTTLQRKLLALHGSDNGYETQHMLQAIYGNKVETINLEIYRQLFPDNDDL